MEQHAFTETRRKHRNLDSSDRNPEWAEEKENAEMQGSRLLDRESASNQRLSSKERKKALLHDVDKLRKKLRHEENVHRALERAFTRPLGALPRLPPYLPPSVGASVVFSPSIDMKLTTLELLAEVAVLEEEVIRLEEQVVNFRQGLYQEAVYISTSKKNIEGETDLNDQHPRRNCKTDQPQTSSQLMDSEASTTRPLPPADCASRPTQLSLNTASSRTENSSNRPLNGKKQPRKLNSSASIPDVGRGKENQSHGFSMKKKQQMQQKATTTRISPASKRPSIECRVMEKQLEPRKLQLQGKDEETEVGSSPHIPDETAEAESNSSEPNRISEDILKCLSNIFLRSSMSKATETVSVSDTSPSTSESSSSESYEGTDFRDPYDICSEFERRDIGPYKYLQAIEELLIDPNRAANCTFLIRRLKLLLRKLASVDLKGLTHPQKLAFWINIYNSCMMNAFLEHGNPASPQMVVALMRKAMINVGGQTLNAMTIEHFILRLPYHSKYVRVYTASQVDSELQAAKRDYLQAAVGISSTKFAIPKLLDWYLLDFAKDLESLLDWICLQLPCALRKEALKCLERGRREPLAQTTEVIPYEFSFRYLLAP
ncbi:hypothetical protein ACLOJK_016475 [Asimina triloba]